MDWPPRVAEVLGCEPWSDDEQQLVLDLARDVAHGTERRYAPLTAYALGLAVGAATATTDHGVATPAERLERVRELAEGLVAAVESGEGA